jgi:hypothetical protein
MARERSGRPPAPRDRRRRSGAPAGEGPRTRPGGPPPPEVALSPEEVRALADEGVDPDDLQAATRVEEPLDEVSPFDRDSAREEIEGLLPEEDH